MSDLWDPMDSSLPGSSVHGTFQASPESPAFAGGIFATEPQ